MIIKKFQEIVDKIPENIAINSGEKLITYKELNTYSNQVANALNAFDKEGAKDSWHQRVALLFGHGADMIPGVIGTLKANKTYIPMETTYPENRLVYMLKNSESGLLLTNKVNFPLAKRLVNQVQKEIAILNIDYIYDQHPDIEVEREALADSPAYILYTSGSTGHPKGVIQNHGNVLYFIRHWIQRFSVTESDRMTLLSAFSHDAAVPDIFAGLLSGACIYPYDIKAASSTYELYTILKKEKITIWHSVPSLFRFFANTLTVKDYFEDIRWVLLGGESLRAHDLELFRSYFPGARLGNIYGQSESTLTSVCTISPQDTFDDVSIGEPLEETSILLVDEDGEIIEDMGIGEIVIASDHTAPGYWQDKETTQIVFTRDDELGRLYWTGDLGRLNANGSIKMVGRKDYQVKIRGFRVETGEIETLLVRHRYVEEAVVSAKEDEKGDNYLCAYIVTNDIVSAPKLRDYLSQELPDYMIPRFFIPLETMPVTPNGKIDRKQLPEPQDILTTELEYEPPSNETEKKLTAIWQEVLEVEKVGIHDSFFELGGHSLLVIAIISKIYLEFHVELQLNDVFNNPTIKELARLIQQLQETSPQATFSPIQPTEEKEFYPLSSPQKRLYIIQQIELTSIAYNLPMVLTLEKTINIKKIENTIKKLIQRHESLKTSFHMISNQPIQRIHRQVDFKIENYSPGPGDQDTGSARQTPGTRPYAGIIQRFIRPFHLDRAPLLRAGMLKTREGNYLIMFDMHHIIADGISQEILVRDFFRIYRGEEITPITFQYKDYTQWQNLESQQKIMENQQNYWKKHFEGEIPLLKLPIDYKRSEKPAIKGSRLSFRIKKEWVNSIKQLMSETDTTLYMILLAMYNLLLSIYTRQQDIIIGTPIAGRRDQGLNDTVGMFVNMLPMRNQPQPAKTLREFINEVKTNSINAFENQDYPFDELVEILEIPRDLSRQPLVETVFTLENTYRPRNLENQQSRENAGDSIYYPFEFNATMFDLTLDALEEGESILMWWTYATELFKHSTIEKLKQHYMEILDQVVKNIDIKLKDIKISHQLVTAESNPLQTEQGDFGF